ncbi:MAG TPA: hypothetical protein VGV14_09985 [Rhodanobacter sp.]|nr:hypothetical protein [Rhodanobacter sp.]
MQLLDDTLLVALFVVVGSRVDVLHAEAHGVVEQYGDLARGGGDGFGLADASRQLAVERTQRRAGLSHRDGS